MAYLNSFRITVLFAVFLVLCYVDWSPKSHKRYARSPLKTRAYKIYNECVNGGELGVTFDEGPNKQFTGTILSNLSDSKIKATFHLVPSYVENNKAIAEKVVEQGHVVGLRLEPKFDTDTLAGMDKAKIKEELEKEANIILENLGVNPKFLRLPYGAEQIENVISVAEELGFIITLWQIDLSEANKSAVEFISMYEEKLKEGYKANINLKPKFIDRNQEGLGAIPDTWYSLASRLGEYDSKSVTLDKCLNIESPYREAPNTEKPAKDDDKNSAGSKAFLSLTAAIFAIFSILLNFF